MENFIEYRIKLRSILNADNLYFFIEKAQAFYRFFITVLKALALLEVLS